MAKRPADSEGAINALSGVANHLNTHNYNSAILICVRETNREYFEIWQNKAIFILLLVSIN